MEFDFPMERTMIRWYAPRVREMASIAFPWPQGAYQRTTRTIDLHVRCGKRDALFWVWSDVPPVRYLSEPDCNCRLIKQMHVFMSVHNSASRTCKSVVPLVRWYRPLSLWQASNCRECVTAIAPMCLAQRPSTMRASSPRTGSVFGTPTR